MIVFLEGVVDHISDSSLFINVHGVGYETSVPTSVLSRVVSGEQIKIYTYHHIREDDQRLFGFIDLNDLEIFKMLISVNGIGPKAGLAILSAYGVSDIVAAIQREDDRLFASVSGIGKKGAAKIVIDLKTKVNGLSLSSSKLGVQDKLLQVSSNELVDALVGLGYSEREIFSHIKEIDTSVGIDKQIKQALGILGK
jgi:Holliday junction DNA helicase RuvA